MTEKNPAWLTPAVLGLAKEIRENFDNSLLPVLADALEEAGCEDLRILDHLRLEGVMGRHYGSCPIVVDILFNSV